MANNEKTITLITGANGGIGFELAAQLLSSPSNLVLLGSRSLSKGTSALSSLQSRNLPGHVALLQIDVTSVPSILSAAIEVEAKYGRLDALVNNAAIGLGDAEGVAEIEKSLTMAFQTNAVGPALVVEAFAPLLGKSKGTVRIVNVTSGAGSIALKSDEKNPYRAMKTVPYRASKSALNMITACQAHEYGELGWKVFLFCPGFTVSNLGPTNNVEKGAKPTSEGASPMVDILAGKRDAEHGGYLKTDGQWPW